MTSSLQSAVGSTMKPGILALQGCIEPHVAMFKRLGIDCLKVRFPKELEAIDRIILPGGESTTMLILLEKQGLVEPLLDFGKSNPVWGICAGAILIAKKVTHPEQRSLGLMNISANRNFYGSQRESFSTEIDISSPAIHAKVDFIRAPLLAPLSEEVEVVSKRDEQTIFLREKRMWATAFHIELGEDTRLHEAFLKA